VDKDNKLHTPCSALPGKGRTDETEIHAVHWRTMGTLDTQDWRTRLRLFVGKSCVSKTATTPFSTKIPADLNSFVRNRRTASFAPESKLRDHENN
jgi:hypothetical protein